MSDRRIIVEVATPEIVERIRSEINDLKRDMNILHDRHEALHRTVYGLMEAIADLKRKLGRS